MKFNVQSEDGTPSNVTVFGDAGSYVADASHPNFAAILDALSDLLLGSEVIDENVIAGLFDTGIALGAKFQPLSERVSINSGRIYFDNVEAKGGLVDKILLWHAEGRDFAPLVAFFENLANNPEEYSRQHLFDYLERHRCSITPDGFLVAYKGVTSITPEGLYKEKGTDFVSCTAGKAIVDGIVVNGQIPNKPGSVIEMPRNEVEFNPAVGCSTGLHAATFNFARGFGSVVLQLKINPRDVVSVPTHEDKLRVCRYLVIGVVTAENTDELIKLGSEPSRTADMGQPHPLDGVYEDGLYEDGYEEDDGYQDDVEVSGETDDYDDEEGPDAEYAPPTPVPPKTAAVCNNCKKWRKHKKCSAKKAGKKHAPCGCTVPGCGGQ